MSVLDLRPMFPEHLVFTGMDQTMRRERKQQGRHRTWQILPRYGTAESDRWTVIGTPQPGSGNPATDIEDGQFPSLQDAYLAMGEADLIDDGTHEKGSWK
jgi:hypothetical protein